MATPLDRIDFDIVHHLQKDARLSNKELAARIGVAPSTCLERVRRLRETGVLRGAHERVDPSALGIGLQAMVAVRLHQHRRESIEEFRGMTATEPAVVACYYLSGANDFLVHVAVRDTEHLRRVVLDLGTREEVRHVETALIFDYIRSGLLPCYVP